MDGELMVLDQVIGKSFAAYHGDSCEVTKGIPDNSIHYSIYSPPFSSLYTYSNSERDIGNAKSESEFYQHFLFLAKELYRILMPGRIMSVHCMDMPMMKMRDGEIGLKDLPGELIRIFRDVGFIYHARTTIWKDPVVEMQRTKALGLLHKQVKKDSAMCRTGLPDYLLSFRKPGENLEPITHTNENFPVKLWQEIASPVWMTVNQSKTLQRESAREERDEKHICPLQLDVIERGLLLYTNQGDTVFSPFMGIGSEGYQALVMGRRFVGVELKGSYFRQAVLNLQRAEDEAHQPTLFDGVEAG